MTEENKDREERDDQSQRNEGADESLTVHISLLMGNLSLFTLGVIDGSHLSRRAVLLERDGGVEDGKDTLACNEGGVAAARLGIGNVFGQHIKLNVVERLHHTHVIQHLVKITVIVCRFPKTVSSHQILIGVNMPRSRLGIVCLLESFIGLGCLILLTKTLIRYGPHNFYTSLILVEIF